MKKERNLFRCKTCATKDEYEKPAFMDHLKTVHDVAENESFKRSMLIHMDGKDFFETQYLWEHEKVSFIQCITCERDKDDPMRHA